VTSRRDRIVLHLAFLYSLAAALFVTTVVVYFTARNRVDRIEDELVELRTRFDEAVAADRPIWWRPRAVAVDNDGDRDATSRRRIRFDGVSQDAARQHQQQRQRRDASERDSVTTSSTAKSDDNGEMGNGSGDEPAVDGRQMVWTNGYSNIPVSNLNRFDMRYLLISKSLTFG
jgi:hypothetical protein